MKGLVSLGGEEFSEFQKEKTASELQVLFNPIKISLGKLNRSGFIGGSFI